MTDANFDAQLVVLNSPKWKQPRQITLETMGHLKEAKTPDDDWTGLTKRKDRKKRQNRLNQRAYRKRVRQDNAVTCAKKKTRMSDGSSETILDSNQYDPKQKRTKDPLEIFFETPSVYEYKAPLSTDHLMLLVQYNVYRGCLSNMKLTGVIEHVPNRLILSFPKQNVPPSMYPTALQQTVKHAAWIDAIPHHTLRDNLITEAGKYNSADYWWDLVGDLHESYEGTDMQSLKTRKFENETSGLICWSESWNVAGFEVSPHHYKKWYKLFRGCTELLYASNKWRARRGELPVRWVEIIRKMECENFPGDMIKINGVD